MTLIPTITLNPHDPSYGVRDEGPYTNSVAATCHIFNTQDNRAIVTQNQKYLLSQVPA